MFMKLKTFLNTPAMLIMMFGAFTLNTGCVPGNDIKVSVRPKKSESALLDISVTNVEVLNNQIIITGSNLDKVTSFKMKEGATTNTLAIESKSSSQIVANTISNVTIGVNKVLDFVLSNAQAASSFTVNFSLCDAVLGGKGFSCTTPTNGQVLAYDNATGKWTAKTINALHYVGTWNPADTNLPADRTTAGDYFVISTSGTHAGNGVSYTVGDWIVWNNDDEVYERVSTSVILSAGAVTQVFGRTGPTITATEGDYTLNLLGDVDLSVAPQTNDVLQFDGSHWVAGTVTTTESDPTVKSFAQAVLPTCTAGQFIRSTDGINFTCASAAFSGTGNLVVATNSSGALAVTAISDTVLGYLSGATSNIQTQINAKASASSIVDWSAAGVAPLIDPSRLTMGVANAGKALVTNGSGLLGVSATTAAQIGYLSGVTSDIQTQIDSKGSAYVGGNNFVVVTDGAGELSDSTISTTKLGYLSGVTSDIQTQLNAKQATINNTTTQDVSKVRIYGANSTNYVELTVATLTGNRTLTFPDSNGTSGYVLSTNGSGLLSWIAQPSAPVTSVFTRTGAVVATAGDYTATQITNTPAGGVAATTAQAAINELDTEKQNIATLADDIRGTVLTGISLVTSTAITAADSILTAIGKIQAQITTANSVASNKLSKNSADSITAVVTVSGAGDIIVPSTPAGMTSAVNKTYVDSSTVANAGGAASVQIGTLAARPLPVAGNTGRMYVANDSGNEAIYVSTGAAWIKIAQNAVTGTIGIANGGTGATTFTGNKSVVVNSGGTALVDGPSIDDTTAVAATLVKRGAGGEVYGQYVVPTTTVTENATCTVPVGTIAKDSAGNLLTCQ